MAGALGELPCGSSGDYGLQGALSPLSKVRHPGPRDSLKQRLGRIRKLLLGEGVLRVADLREIARLCWTATYDQQGLPT